MKKPKSPPRNLVGPSEFCLASSSKSDEFLLAKRYILLASFLASDFERVIFSEALVAPSYEIKMWLALSEAFFLISSNFEILK